MNQVKQINNRTIRTINSMPNQKGFALVITLVVLLVLTIIGIASTDSNQLQAALVRNSQFRLEVFNASYSEIDAQIDNINTNTTIAGGLPPTIEFLIKNTQATIDSVNDPGLIVQRADHPKMDKFIENGHVKQCTVSLGSQIGANKELFDCHIIQINSDATLLDINDQQTNIRSQQTQYFEYETFANN